MASWQLLDYLALAIAVVLMIVALWHIAPVISKHRPTGWRVLLGGLGVFMPGSVDAKSQQRLWKGMGYLLAVFVLVVARGIVEHLLGR